MRERLCSHLRKGVVGSEMSPGPKADYCGCQAALNGTGELV